MRAESLTTYILRTRTTQSSYVHRYTTTPCQALFLDYTLKLVTVTLTATDILGADLSEPLVLLWHHHREGA